VISKFEDKRHIVYLSSFILGKAYLGKWPRLKEQCMGSRGLLPLLLLSITPMCVKGVARKKV
jgi:hypothetical protein